MILFFIMIGLFASAGIIKIAILSWYIAFYDN
jgi:hypothetical protein